MRKRIFGILRHPAEDLQGRVPCKEEIKMKIVDVRINGMKRPMGYAFSEVTISWKVIEAVGKKQKKAKIIIASDLEMKDTIATIEGELKSYGQQVELELQPRTSYYVKTIVTADSGEVAESEVASFDTGKMDEPWQGKWIGMAKEDSFHPLFRKAFVTKKEVNRARLYVCGVGLYEAYLGEKKIGDDFLAPFFNDYNCALQSQTYDITAMLAEHNVISIMLGNGWYKGRLGYEGRKSIYGDRFACIGEVHIEYRDGSEECIVTDESWEYGQSEVISSDIYDGEWLDKTLYLEERFIPRKAQLLDMSDKKLVDRYSMPLEVMEEIAVKEVIHTPKGEMVLDFGQNFAGYVQFAAKLDKGTKVVLSHGEILQNGNFYHDNYRTAKSEFIYIASGEFEVVHPRFTYMGFRYVKVEGWHGEIKKEEFVGKAVCSAMERTGYLETGHKKVNQLVSNALWGLKSNFLDMPTDCPQRDERLGWTGDAQVFAPTATFFMDTRAFYRKFLWDMRNDQVLRDGAIANYLPNINEEPGGSSVWGDAATFIPMTLFEAYGDKSALAESYPLMKEWVEWIKRGDEKRESGPKYLFDYAFSFGDWLALDGISPQSFKGGTEDAYVSSIYYYASLRKLEAAASILEKKEDEEEYKVLAKKVRTAILQEYFTPNGRLAIDTQTGYIIALYFGVYKDKECLKKGFRERLKKDGYRIKCGFVGTPLICETLSENGMEDLASHIFLQEEFPSWLHCVNLGATTIWERWNSVLDDGSISGTGMNSLNHYAYGSVIHYAVNNIAGLKPLTPGFKKVRFAPTYQARLKFVDCTYQSVSGDYRIYWEIRRNGEIAVRLEVPFDGEASVCLPGYRKGEFEISSGVTELVYRPEKDYRNLYDWKTILEDYRRDCRAMEIFKESLPVAYGMAQTEDPENLGLTLGEMRYMPWFGFEQEDVEKTAEKLFSLKMETKYSGLIFDLDGVIVDTAKYHFIAWKEIADELGIPFTKEDNERLKGVSRQRSLEIILEIGNQEMSAIEKNNYCQQKNEIYLTYIRKMTAAEILPGVKAFIESARREGYKIALGSASKNALLILDRLELTHLFDAIIDGTKVSKAKPDPEVFIKGAEALQVPVEKCVVFEDATAGIAAAHAGNMKAVGVGSRHLLPEADYNIEGFVDFDTAMIAEI